MKRWRGYYGGWLLKVYEENLRKISRKQNGLLGLSKVEEPTG
jgi:hypothetical protein